MKPDFILEFNFLELKIPALPIRLFNMKLIFLILSIASPFHLFSQNLLEDLLLKNLKSGGQIKEELLSKRTAVLYSYTLTPKELQAIHDNFIKTGIDAVVYFDTEIVLAGRDAAKAYSAYLTKREIATLILIKKTSVGYALTVGSFSNNEKFLEPTQPVWRQESNSLGDVLTQLYRSALAGNTKKNFLINDFPETDLPVTIFNGRRSELTAFDLKVDNLAVVKLGDEVVDKELEEIFKSYPFKYKLVDGTISESDLRKQGLQYILCVVNTRAQAAKKVLEYNVTKAESAYVSVSYEDGHVRPKNIGADIPVTKFYVRHIDSGNVFLGTKWDADTTWQQSLRNFIQGLKIEFKIN
jgi:hypothetical protein